MSNARAIAIYGAGGFAREVAWLLSNRQNRTETLEFVGYVDDAAKQGPQHHGWPVLLWEEFRKKYSAGNCLLSIAIGEPRVRRRVVQKCSEEGFSFATLIHSSVAMSEYVQLGPGCIICAGNIITVEIDIGEHVHINLDCTVGHDVTIGAFSTLSPGVHVSGNVQIGDDVYVGTGATIINGLPDRPLVIGNGTVIGAGACVTQDTESNSLYAGVPAALKKRYG